METDFPQAEAVATVTQCLPPHLAVSLAILALLADPVDGVEVVIRAHPRDGLLQEVQQVGGAAGHPSPVGHDVVRT